MAGSLSACPDLSCSGCYSHTATSLQTLYFFWHWALHMQLHPPRYPFSLPALIHCLFPIFQISTQTSYLWEELRSLQWAETVLHKFLSFLIDPSFLSKSRAGIANSLGGFPGGSAIKKLPADVGGLGSIPGLGRSPREGNDNPLQYYWTSLVAQMVKNLPAVEETRVQSLDQDDPLEKGMATHSSILAWRVPWTEEPGGLQSMGLQRVRHD